MFNLNQWVNWHPIQVNDEPKVRKVPFNGYALPYWDGVKVVQAINQLNPINWQDYNTAVERYSLKSFIFTENDPYFVIDLDHHLNLDGTWSDLANRILGMFPGAYIEISYSGDGLHIIAQGIKPDGFQHKNSTLGLEVYDRKRSMCITGTSATGTPDIDHQAALNLFCSSYIETTVKGGVVANYSNVPRADWRGPEDDQELINKMLSSRPSADSLWMGKATIVDLWTGNTDAFLKSYPDGKDGYDASSVDAALFSHLAFWTGCNHERMNRISRLSALYQLRPGKWDRTGDDYVVRSCVSAASVCVNVYQDKSVTEVISPVNQSPLPVATQPIETQPIAAQSAIGTIREAGYQYLDPTQQLEFFKGCYYIINTHRILVPGGAVLTPQQFKAVYSIYDFALDNINDKITKCAWEAFVNSRAVRFPKVTRMMFRPDLEPGKIINVEGEDSVNAFYPVPVEMYEGDVSRFLELVSKLFPNERDRTIILSYMAACVQYIGIKFRWCPVVQGAEGNGKTTLPVCISYAVGERLSHTPNPTDLGNKFNFWIENNVFAIIEELRISDNRDMVATLKIMITNKKLEIQPKGGNQYKGDNRVNFWGCTNFMDAIKKTLNDRRYAPFFTPQQSYADILADGLTDAYFLNLYKWLESGGFANVAYFLKHYDIPDEFNPTLMARAPWTSSTAKSIEVSQGPIEQEIQNAIDEDQIGFRGGWISSIKLHEMLVRTGKDKFAPRNKRAAMLESLGYKPVGRASRSIFQEKGKPYLFAIPCLEGSNNTEAYVKAQGYADFV